MLGGRDCVDDNQLTTATWARQCQDTGWLIGVVDTVVLGVLPVWRLDPEQVPDPGDIGGPVAVSKEAVVADAVLSFWQNVDQEPADELVRFEGHDLVPTRTVDAIILDAEGDAVVVHADQAAVGNRDTVCVSRQIGQHSLGSGEGFLCVDDPVDFTQWFEEIVEAGLVGKIRMIAEEVQFPGIMQLGQPFQNETPVQARQHPDG